MGPLTALVLATPIFGFALAPPHLDGLPQAALSAAQIESSTGFELDTEGSAEAEGPTQAAVDDKAQYVSQLRKRAKLAKVHRTLGIATWVSMAIAVASGTVQYRNLYGGGKLENTPCVQGNAWPNQNQCSGSPLLHAIPGFVTGGLYFTTMGLEMFMPDPDHASQGDSKFAKTLRTHKILRWIHLAGMLAQIGIGIAIANPGLGLERESDYKTLQALSRAHLGVGYATFAALTWAGTIMLL